MKILLVSASILLLITVGFFVSLFVNHPVGVEELWKREYRNRNLEGKTVVVRGDILFEPFSDFRFNAVYIVDSDTAMNLRSPSFAFWFGVGIDGVSCVVEDGKNLMTCEPFDPTHGAVYEFKGTINIDQIGKKEIMWLSDIDFENSRQLVNGEWEPIPLGKFIVQFEE
ncbi:MAG TPA: hypothetical protein VK851_03265 [Anaerolineales bacterium]|nr:hypothetical protein [Anaerolineales bacterium]